MTTDAVDLSGDFAEAVTAVLQDVSWAAGLTVAVTDRSGILAQAACGVADLATGRPVQEGTLFEIGSISKGFTAALLLQARDAGLIDLDAPVTRYLPWFAVETEFDPITVRHLLTHTAGVVRGAEFTGEAAFEAWDLRHTRATTPPGSWFFYSNTGYKALGQVVEAVYGRPYEQVLADQLLAPLGMTASEAAITHDTRRRLATGYLPYYDDRVPDRAHGLAPATWVETATADGSIASTAADMTAWLRLLLGDGRGPDGATVLAPQSLEEMLTGVVDAEDPGERYGLGMYVYDRDGHSFVAHTGGMVGYGAAIVVDRGRGLAAVVIANGSGPWSEVAHHAVSWADAVRSGSATPPLVIPDALLEKAPDAPSVIDEPPAEWREIVGHYRGFNPWLPNIRVQASGGRLWVWQGDYTSDLGDPLVALDDGSFRIGDDERSPERLRFDVVLGGGARRATLSGYPLYRTFTP